MQPSEPPPPYQEAATGASSSTLQVPGKSRSSIPPQIRRSMEDESRPVPEGWVRQYDPKEEHQFFVDTRSNPPRSIWHHPYDDEQYMISLSPEERRRIQDLPHAPPDDLDESSNDEVAEPPQRPAGTAEEPVGARRLGRKVKNALTRSTHEEREARRRERDAQEQRAYETHRRIRAAMARAAETGEPQLVGKDSRGKDVYIEPPYGAGSASGWSGGGAYGGGAYGYNPYTQGPYAMPGAGFMRPQQPYSRPFGGGYGGGYGLGGFGGPMLGLGGGLMLGSLLF